MTTLDITTLLSLSSDAYYFWLVILALLLAFCACFLIAATAMSISEWLQGESFIETFSYCWNNL